jgi:hypothetical protein
MSALSTERQFYEGNGFNRLTGDGAESVDELHEKLVERRKSESLKGNLYAPRLTADFLDNSCGLADQLSVMAGPNVRFCTIAKGAAWGVSAPSPRLWRRDLSHNQWLGICNHRRYRVSRRKIPHLLHPERDPCTHTGFPMPQPKCWTSLP